MTIDFVDLRNNDRDVARMKRFYEELFVPGFPDEDERESLETLRENLVKVESGFYGINAYHILLALDDERPVAACVLDYLAESSCGAIEYIIVADDRRGEGIGRAIHDRAVETAMRDAGTAGRKLNAVMIEVNDPYRAPPELDTVDPFSRVMMWHKWGYQRLVFPYEQPALSPTQSSIDYLLMAVKVFNDDLRAGFSSALARQLVIDYLVWANRLSVIDDDPFFHRMTAYAAAHPVAALEPLDHYIGRIPLLTTNEVADPTSAEFTRAMAVYRRAFPPGPTAIGVERFEQRLRQPLPLESRYHLWTLGEQPDAPAAGMTSFFSMPGLGFLAYLVFEPAMSGRGLARIVLKRIEEAMFRDRSDITCCYVECDKGTRQEAVFKRLGFRDVGFDYVQPNLTMQGGEGFPMSLLRKPLGDQLLAREPGRSELETELKTIMTVVYGSAAPTVAQN